MPDKAVYTTKNELSYFLHFLDGIPSSRLPYSSAILRALCVLSQLNNPFIPISDTNPIIQEFLQHDSSYCLADKYLIAMVFIYFKRAHLTRQDYTYLNFFAGLCLAHSMEEDIELSSEIYFWALGSKLKDQLPNLLELKMLLWVAMDYRAAVSWHCCKQLISISMNHPVWQRERSPLCLTRFHSLEACSYSSEALHRNKTAGARKQQLKKLIPIDEP